MLFAFRFGPAVFWMMSTSAVFGVENNRLSGDIEALGNDVRQLGDNRGRHFDTFDIRELQLTRDGTRVVYLADDDYDGVQELYSVPVDGSAAPIRLHEPIAPPHDTESDIVAFSIASPDAGAPIVVYGVGTETGRRFELWTVEVDDPSSRTRLVSEALFPTPQAGHFVITPDGSHVVFNAFTPGENAWELFSVPLGQPDSAVKLSAGPAEIGGVSKTPMDQLQLSPDSRWVVYVAKRDTDPHIGIYSAEIQVSGSERHLNAGHVYTDSTQGPQDVAITPDSTTVLYRGREYAGRVDLISVPVDGTGAIKMISEGSGSTQGFQVSAAGNRIAYRSQTQFPPSSDLYVTSPSGANPPTPLRGGSVSQFALTPDGETAVYSDGQDLFARSPGGPEATLAESLGSLSSFAVYADGMGAPNVIFLADLDTGGVAELYSVPVAGGTPIRIHQPRTDIGLDFDVNSFQVVQVASGAPYVLFNGTGSADERIRLFSAPATPDLPGGTETELSGSISEGGAVVPRMDLTLLSAPYGLVIFTADRRTDDILELFAVPVSGGDPILLNRGNAPVGDVVRAWTGPHPDTSWLVYRADAQWDERFDLYAVPGNRDSDPRRLNEIEHRTSGADTGEQVAFSEDGSQVYFLGPSPGSAVPKLFMHTFSTGLTTQLSPDDVDVAPNSQVLAFRLHPDGQSAVYLANHQRPANAELFRVRFGQPKLATKLGTDIPGYASIQDDFLITPGGNLILFRADLDADDQYGLFALDPDSGLVADVSKLPPGQGDVSPGGFRLVMNDQQVLFRADPESSGRAELFVASLSGVGVPTRISGDLPPGGRVAEDFLITFDGRHAVFRADGTRDNQPMLFSVDLDAASPARVRLHPSYPAQAPGVLQFALHPSEIQDPDAIQVAFRAVTAADGNPELFLATVGIPDAAENLSPVGQHNDADVAPDFVFSPDGSRVVFRSDALGDSRYSLYTSAAAGVGALAHPPLTGDQTVLSFAVSPDGYRVVYRVGIWLDGQPSGPVGLFSVPLDSAEEPTRIALDQGAFTDVEDPILFPADSARVYFRDDRRKDGTRELYAAYELPRISHIEDQYIPIDEVWGPISFTVSDLETRPAEIQVTAHSSDPDLIPEASITISRQGADWQMTLAPMAGAVGGPITITVTAVAKGETVSEMFTVCIGSMDSEYQEWLDLYFDSTILDDPAREATDWGYAVDADQDGMSNLEEWAKGLNPTNADADRDFLSARRAGNVFIVTFRRGIPTPKWLEIGFESSDGLASDAWTQVSFSDPFPVVGESDNAERVEATFPIPPEPATRRFLRMRYSGRSQ